MLITIIFLCAEIPRKITIMFIIFVLCGKTTNARFHFLHFCCFFFSSHLRSGLSLSLSLFPFLHACNWRPHHLHDWLWRASCVSGKNVAQCIRLNCHRSYSSKCWIVSRCNQTSSYIKWPRVLKYTYCM